jgi:hypothetical protein
MRFAIALAATVKNKKGRVSGSGLRIPENWLRGPTTSRIGRDPVQAMVATALGTCMRC